MDFGRRKVKQSYSAIRKQPWGARYELVAHEIEQGNKSTRKNAEGVIRRKAKFHSTGDDWKGGYKKTFMDKNKLAQK